MKQLVSGDGDQARLYRATIRDSGACERGDEVQTVLCALCCLASDLEGPGSDGDVLPHPTVLHSLIFAGILRAFYGDAVVDRAAGARAQRKADAPQHVHSGTWPRRPVD